MTARSGHSCARLLRASGPLGSLVKMCLASSTWNSTACYLIWRPSATPAGRLLFRLAPWTRATEENESGLWPTPRSSPNENRQLKTSPSQLAGKHGMNLAAAVKLCPTPDACAAERYNTSPSPNAAQRPTLALAVKLFPSPTAGDSKNARNSTANRKTIPPSGIHKGHTLTDVVTLYPTPDAVYSVPIRLVTAEPDISVSTVSPVIPTVFHTAVVDTACLLFYEQLQDSPKMALLEQKVDRHIKRMREYGREYPSAPKIRVRDWL